MSYIHKAPAAAGFTGEGEYALFAHRQVCCSMNREKPLSTGHCGILLLKHFVCLTETKSDPSLMETRLLYLQEINRTQEAFQGDQELLWIKVLLSSVSSAPFIIPLVQQPRGNKVFLLSPCGPVAQKGQEPNKQHVSLFLNTSLAMAIKHTPHWSNTLRAEKKIKGTVDIMANN